MSVTFEANYAEVLKPETVEFIKANEEEYALDCMLEFLDTYGEDDFVQFYDTYIEMGEKLGYDVVDAFIKEEGIVNIEYVEDAFVGVYSSEAAFVEEYLDDVGYNIPAFLVVDWQATWDQSLRFDYTFVDGYVFRSDY